MTDDDAAGDATDQATDAAAKITIPEAAPETAPETAGDSLPDDVIPVIPVRNLVQFPGVVLPVTVGRARSIAAAQEAARRERAVGILLQRDEAVEEPTGADMHRIGTTANILRYVTTPDGSHHLVCQGLQRFRVVEWVPGHPFLAARVEMVEESEVNSPEVKARFLNLRNEAAEALQLLPQAPQELLAAVQAIDSPAELADMTASYMDLKPAEKQGVLETIDLLERLEKVGSLLAQRIEVLRISRDIRERTREAMDERQREFLLREQLRAIQKELGEADEGRQAEIGELQDAIVKAGMPPDVREHAEKELRRLERMPEAAQEYSMVRTYLDWLIEMPWDRLSESSIDIAEARRILDEDHYGLEKVKRRILEFLAVRKLNPEGRSPILCFVGPPGVGKTSLGQSIARATGRAFARVSLGGVHDESEIRGHRRTYVGALPGNIVQAIRKAGTRDCVLMLDEMDKLGQGFHGDPSAALLEVLDPEQNATFRDHYLGVAFDLSKVMFIATANVLDTIPGPLRDRMELIELSGYTEDEKLEIAKRYLVKRQLAANGLRPDQLEIPDDTLRAIIRDHTREAGNRNLERMIGAVARHVAVRIAEGQVERLRVDPPMLTEILGPPRFENDVAMRTSVPGVATGLAWTPVGGDILFIEASRFPGSGRLILTGQLGDVMKESAQAALSLIKSRVRELGLDPEGLDKFDIHVHVPAGAIPKDGPSAGVAMFTALVSLLSGRCVRADTAMTGEISLRGLVLPVGGIREKVVAAQRAGLKTVMLPARNRKDYDDIPAAVRDQLTFVWLERVDDAVRAALSPPEAETQRKVG
ncbi:endopeptidase La [Azospirillum canadense]|uniref:endopeptidase La n=1 Tax=Azospirillum canadense TaxID=403962 RepID=UPI002226F49C|nr:endopeptidase La [Azospirillum canadense]MCW2243531.1 ATP-dependent Lon protease [Azospirillum canadense]